MLNKLRKLFYYLEDQHSFSFSVSKWSFVVFWYKFSMFWKGWKYYYGFSDGRYPTVYAGAFKIVWGPR